MNKYDRYFYERYLWFRILWHITNVGMIGALAWLAYVGYHVMNF